MPNVLITGGAKRIGAELARRFAREGFGVAVHYNRSRPEAEALAAELRAAGAACALVQGDLERRAEVDQLFEAACAALGPMDLVINNAALFLNDDIFGITEDNLDRHFAVNLKAPLYLAEKLALQAGDGDRLVLNLLDNKLLALNPDFFSYTISKAALFNATEMLAMRFDGRPRVCAIAPSITLISGKQTPEAFETSARINPLGRRVFPEDIAEAALMLWQNTAMNAQVLAVDGGQALLQLPRDVAYLAKEGLIHG